MEDIKLKVDPLAGVHKLADKLALEKPQKVVEAPVDPLPPTGVCF